MAQAAVKTFVAGEVLYAADLNALNTNILNNATALVSPWTASMDAGEFDLTSLDELAFIDAAANASVAGRLRRNSANLTWHDGTAAGRLFYAGGTDVPVADGGTGLSSGTSGGVLAYTAAGTLASSGALTANGFVLGGGAGAAPTSTAAPTNGQLPIGNTGNAPTLAALTALTGGGITITNGAGTITLSRAWTDELTGLTLSNNGTDPTNDIDIAVGAAGSEDAAIVDRRLMSLTTAITKQLDAVWAVGTNQGMLDTGSIANTTYHIYLIMRTDTGVVDVLASTSATSPTMPTSYDKRRRIGSIVRSGDAILAFSQVGDEFLWTTVPALDVNVTDQGTSAVSRTLTVPIGIVIIALINVLAQGAGVPIVYLSALDQTSQAASATATPLGSLKASTNNQTVFASMRIRTNTSGQIRSIADAASTTLRIATLGWIDRRGRG